MPTVIDSLQIEIQSGSADASEKIDKLAGSLERLRTNGKLTTVTKNLTALSTAVKGLSGISGSASSLYMLAIAVERLRNIKSIASLTNNLSKLPAALKGIENMSLGRVEEQIRGIASAVRPLTEIKTSGFASMVNGMAKIDKVTRELDDAKINAFAERVKKLNDLLGPLSEKMATIGPAFRAINTGAGKAAKVAEKFDHGVNTSTLNLASFIEVARTAAQAVASLVQRFVEFISAAIEWDGVKAQFGNAFGEQADEYYDKITKITEALRINKQAFMENSAMAASMLTGFGVKKEDAREMGLGYTELAYDIWAAYNNVYKTLDGADGAMAAVRSAIAGEVEPIRRAGFTIVESTLEQTAAQHGLNISIEKATEAQKSYLRYLTLVDQAQSKGVVGTFAREMDTAEGMMRTFSQQLKSLTQAFGSLFLPILVKVMPYFQAFIELLEDGVRMIAAFFGIEIQDIGDTWYDYSTSVDSAAEGTEAVTDALGDAANAAKDLKNATLGIDELNVISPKASSDSGSGSGGSGGGFDGLDVESLWDESIFNNVKDQVDQIKEKFKEWLPVLSTIGTLLGGLTMASFLKSVGDSMAEMDLLKKSLATTVTIAAEAVLVFVLADNYLETGNLLNLLGEAIVTATAGYLMFRAWGVKGAVFALGVSILAQLAAITLNLADGGVDITDPQLWIQSAFTTALVGIAGGLLAYKKIIPMSTGKGVGLGLLAGISLTLAAITIGEVTANGELTGESLLTGIGSVLAAAGFGFTVGGPVGALVGAAVGLVVNVVGAEIGKFSANAEKNLKEDLADRFGSIELDDQSIKFYVDKITAIPRTITINSDSSEDVTIPVTAALELYASEASVMYNIKNTIESISKKLDSQNVKIALGIGVEYEDYTSEVDAYVTSAQEYLDQYYLTAGIAIDILDSDSSAGLSETLSAFYTTNSAELARLGSEMKAVISDAFVDGEWIPDKLQEAIEIHKEIQEVLDYISEVEYMATMENIKLSVTGTDLTPESFGSVITKAQTAIEDRLKSLEEVKMENLKVAVMQYKANIADGVSEAEAARIRDETIADIEAAYQAGVVEVTYGTFDFGLETIRSAFENEITVADSKGWFDYTKQISEVLRIVPNTFEGNNGEYLHINQLVSEISGRMQAGTYTLSGEARKNLESVLSKLEPTVADIETVAKANREAGVTVPENISKGLNDYNELKAISGDVDAINYLIGKGFSTDTAFLNTLATAEGAGKQIDDSVASGLLDNIQYVTDEATGVVTGIKNSVTGEVIAVTPTLSNNMRELGVNLSKGLASGVEEDKPNLWERIGSWADGIIGKVKSFFGIKSPSKKMKEIGGYLSDGLSEGIDTSSIKNPISTAWNNAKKWWDSKTSLTTYTPNIGSIKDKVSSAWTTALNWYNSKKTKMKDYTPSIGSIYSKVKESWNTARTWWNDKKTAMKKYTPDIGSILDKVKDVWNTAKNWWNNNVKGLKLDIKTPKIKLEWTSTTVLGKTFKYPTGFDVYFAANGGIFDAGSLIWAGERGAEIVANAGGGKTGVMNIEQMQEAVYEGVYAAMSAAMSKYSGGGSQGVNVYLDSRQITSSVEQRQREKGASIMGNEVFA